MNPLIGDPWVALCVLAVALLLDVIYPYHRGLALKLHPVHTSFMLGSRLVRPYASRAYGVLLWFAVVLLHLLPTALLAYSLLWLSSSSPVFTALYIVTASLVVKVSSPIALLVKNGLSAYKYAVDGDWGKVRSVVQGMVRRDLRVLNDEEVMSACIESLAESLVDGFISPLTYYPLLGVVGPFLQRLSNTLDGLVGFKTPELLREGWFSAKVDTLFNYLPARLAALYIILSSMILGYNWREAFRIWLRDRRNTESFNAGNPMAAMAGALGVMLRKPGHYTLGDDSRPIEPYDVRKAVNIVISSASLHIATISSLILLQALI